MANYIRCINYRTKEGIEGIIFTRELEESAADFIPPNATIESDSDEFQESVFPSGFPFETNFENRLQ
jgi:hypothetical protein